MSSHVFAVWDFMTLVKTLQRALTCVETPWLPPEHPEAARLVNAIVLGEESDEVAPGIVTSHFGLYLDAMDEVSANRSAIESLLRGLRDGRPWRDALEAAPTLPSTRVFVETTMGIAEEGRTHEIAAAFLYGREDLVPQMFRRILETLDAQPSLGSRAFRLYLDRHVQVDERDHGPMAQGLLRSLCGEDERRWAQAAGAARAAMYARLHFWDGVLEEIRHHADTRPLGPVLARLANEGATF
jgi:hypothetical protein